MGHRGPKPLSAEHLRLRGSSLANQRRREEDAVPIGPSLAGCLTEEEMSPPDTFTGEAESFWYEYAEELVESGVLTARTYAGFMMLCEAWADYHDARKAVDAEGMTVTGARGNLKKHPAVQIRDRALQQFNSMARRSTRCRASPNQGRGRKRRECDLCYTCRACVDCYGF